MLHNNNKHWSLKLSDCDEEKFYILIIEYIFLIDQYKLFEKK